MPNTPAQLPNIDLPGAEFFSFAPNATIALQGRRRFSNFFPAFSVPANSSVLNQQNAQIESSFTLTSGIYVHRAWLTAFPQDAAAELQITSAMIGLNTQSTSATNYPLGISVSTNLNPGAQNVAVLERDVMAAARDINATAGGFTNTLNIAYSVTVKNLDATNPHSMQFQLGIIYTRLDGLQE